MRNVCCCRPIYEADIRITTTTMLEEFDAAGGERTGTDTVVLCGGARDVRMFVTLVVCSLWGSCGISLTP